jgi:gliding motility-associated-like protein
MRKTILISQKSRILEGLFLLIFALLSVKNQAQCAGNDASATICDVANSANRTLNLFSYLGGSPEVGGVWTDDDDSKAINLTTGILNIWEVAVAGTYNFTYTVSGVSGCSDTSSTVSINVGNYAGLSTDKGSACSDDTAVNLFQFFVGNSAPPPQTNGIWTDNDNSGGLRGNFLNAEASGPGVYSFTYTVSGFGSCPTLSSTVSVTVYRAVKSGSVLGPVRICSKDIADYKDINLFNTIEGEDAGGKWTEYGTSELTFFGDSTINLQNIYNARGAGTYTFSYTVKSTNPICTDKTTNVDFIIEEYIDYTGATLVVNSDICEDKIGTATYTGVLRTGPKRFPNGEYEFTYSVSGAGTGIESLKAFASAGVMSFPINPAFFNKVGSYVVNISSMNYVNRLDICNPVINVSDEITIFPLPKINDAKITIETVCKNSDVIVELSDLKIPDGSYQIIYDVSGSNSLTGIDVNISVVSENASFTIPASSVPNAGTNTLKITNITNLTTGCTNTTTLSRDFLINDLPNTTNMKVTVNDLCVGETVSVSVSGLGTLSDVTLTYNLLDANIANNETVNLNPVGGVATFILRPELIQNSGKTSLALINIVNNTTTCSVSINGLSDDFTINTLPNAPFANDAVFCEVDNPVISNLLPAGNQYQWFDSATSTTPLNASTALVSGNYYVQETSTTGCTSSRTSILVTINVTPAPTLNTDGQNFCALDNPTIMDLTKNTNAAATLSWFDAAIGGKKLAVTEKLVDGVTYFGYDSSPATGCISKNNLSVTVSLTECNKKPEEYSFFIPTGFSPNGDDNNDTYEVENIGLIFPQYTIEIFNRYGNLVFKGDKNKSVWDGKSKESSNIGDGVLPNGVYFYVINFNKNNLSPKQGQIYLNR